MKRLSMIMVCLLAMMAAGLSVKAQEVTITLYPGWNWISYPKTEVLDVNTALGDFVPVDGDKIKSQFSNSAYFNGYWKGGVTHFIPGWGYMYYSNRTEVVSLVFGESAPQLTVTTAEPTEITANSAVSGGSITSNDGNYVFVLEKGICWATHPNPMVMNDSFTQNGNGPESFTAEMTDLTPNTVYYVRAYAVTQNGTTYGEEVSFTTLDIPIGAINGLFTINDNGDQVYFSQGNLQYQATTNTWRFAENQWDFVGGNNSNISETYSGWIDLFGWGTSGYDHGAICYQPWSTSNDPHNYYAYGQSTYNLFDLTGQADWGYNAISNGGNQENLWHTLTGAEWDYILNNRITNSGKRFAMANVNNIGGIILLPDEWSSSYFNLNNTNSVNAGYSGNTITAYEWSNLLEPHGAVFLPAAGIRGQAYGTMIFYWSSTYYNNSNQNLVGAFYVSYSPGYTPLQIKTRSRSEGLSVRLVQYYYP